MAPLHQVGRGEASCGSGGRRALDVAMLLCLAHPPPSAPSQCSVNKAAGEAWPCIYLAVAPTLLGAMPTMSMFCLQSQSTGFCTAPLWRESIFSMPPDICAGPTSSSCKTLSMRSREFYL